MNPNITIVEMTAQIAQMTGYSKRYVKKAFNTGEQMNRETREKILKIAEERFDFSREKYDNRRTFGKARKEEILRMRAEGYSSAEIARAVGVSIAYIVEVAGRQPEEITLAARERRRQNYYANKASREACVGAMKPEQSKTEQPKEPDMIEKMQRALSNTENLKKQIADAVAKQWEAQDAFAAAMAEVEKKRKAVEKANAEVEQLQGKLKTHEDMLNAIRNLLNAA